LLCGIENNQCEMYDTPPNGFVDSHMKYVSLLLLLLLMLLLLLLLLLFLEPQVKKLMSN